MPKFYFGGFLRAYLNSAELEYKRINNILLIMSGMFIMFLLVSIVHYYFDMHWVHYIADFIGLFSMIYSIHLVKEGFHERASSVVVWSLVFTLFIYGVGVDYFTEKEVEFLRLYVTLFCVFGLYLLVLSLFKTFRYYLLLSMVFSVIIISHAYTIVMHNGGWSIVTSEMWSYFFIALIVTNVGGFITHIVSRHNTEMLLKLDRDAAAIQNHTKNLNELVDRQTAELKESNERLKSFAHVASHDIREPLRTLSGFSFLLNRHISKFYAEDKKLHEYADFIGMGAQRMEGLVTDILSFSEISKTLKSFEEVNLNEVLVIVLQELKQKIDERKAVVESGVLPTVKGQKNLLVQVFLNLISNSIKYSKPGLNPYITISCSPRKKGADIVLSDNGIGIKSSLHSKVFQPYYSSGSIANDKSTGMGLAIVRKIIEFHGGEIWVESDGDSGSQFHCVFPAECVQCKEMKRMISEFSTNSEALFEKGNKL